MRGAQGARSSRPLRLRQKSKVVTGLRWTRATDATIGPERENSNERMSLFLLSPNSRRNNEFQLVACLGSLCACAHSRPLAPLKS